MQRQRRGCVRGCQADHIHERRLDNKLVPLSLQGGSVVADPIASAEDDGAFGPGLGGEAELRLEHPVIGINQAMLRDCVGVRIHLARSNQGDSGSAWREIQICHVPVLFGFRSEVLPAQSHVEGDLAAQPEIVIHVCVRGMLPIVKHVVAVQVVSNGSGCGQAKKEVGHVIACGGNGAAVYDLFRIHAGEAERSARVAGG